MSAHPLRALGLSAVALGFFGLAACEKSGDFLLPAEIDGVPGITHIEAEGGGPFQPVRIDTREDVEANTIYTEIGPTGDVRRSGITMEFTGTGGSVCAFVDPETVAWNQSVSVASPERRWRLPDNQFDDGDVDMQVGLSLYYRGTPGQQMAGFEVQYQDALGNDVEVELVACRNFTTVLGNDNFDAHAGRGTAEFCTIENTQPGVNYMVALEGFSLPPDDYRLGVGILIAQGPCEGADGPDEDTIPDGLLNRITPLNPQEPLLIAHECLIRGESIRPKSEGTQVYYGLDESLAWPESINLEDTFCTSAMNTYCNQERLDKLDAGVTCSRTETGPDLPEEERCYCGDNRDTPTGGANEF